MSALGQFTKDVAEALNRLARPVLTFSITAAYNGLAGWAFVMGKITWTEYATAVGPVNAMIVGHWFGERAALKQPAPPGKEPEEP